MTIDITPAEMTQAGNCAIQLALLLGLLFFWGLASRRWGGGVDTSLHPMKGQASGGVHIFFAVVVLALMLLVIYSNLR